ncbi:MAG: hypothetical protein R2792_15125 [Saprospiraceae bacterium]
MRFLKTPCSIRILFLTVLFAACDPASDQFVKSAYLNEQDPGFKYTIDSLALFANIQSEQLTIPAMNNWNEIIRLRGESGWGDFDIICSIYNDDNKRIQLIYQGNDISPGETSFMYKERILPDSEYVEILDLLDQINYYEMPFQVGPKGIQIDGNMYTLAVKKGAFRKVVFCTSLFDNDSPEKGQFVRVFKDILDRANYPTPKALVMRNSELKDSIDYIIYPTDFHLYTSYYVEYNGQRLPEKNGVVPLTLSLNDTSRINDLIHVYINLSNGELREIEDLVIRN